MYPSAANGAGMRPLVDALAARGLKLGLWLMRGVPRSAAAAHLPIFGSTTNSTCFEAARFDKPCAWSTSCHGSSYPATAAAEYYQSVAQLLMDWGVEFVKADCFFPSMPYPGASRVRSGTQLACEADALMLIVAHLKGPQPHGYYDEDIIGFGAAMKTANVTVSWSPGISVTPANGTFIARNGYGASYRVSEDMWDLFDSAADGTFPTGIRQKLQLSEQYAHLIGANNSFPDWDMLPLGTMMHASKEKGVYGPASPTFLTRSEQTTAMTLWSITRAPLMFGGRLPLDANDTWTLPLISARLTAFDMLFLLTFPMAVQRILRCCTCITPARTVFRCTLQGLLRTATMLGLRSQTPALTARTGAAPRLRCSTRETSAARSSSTSPACAWAARPLLRRRSCAAATFGRAARSCRHPSSTSLLPRCVAIRPDRSSLLTRPLVCSCHGTEQRCMSSGAPTTARQVTRCSRHAQAAAVADNTAGSGPIFSSFHSVSVFSVACAVACALKLLRTHHILAVTS